jgi:hypothetical protein
VQIAPELSYARFMTIDSIIAQLDSEIARLTQVRGILASSAKTTSKFALPKAGKGTRRKKRVLSPEARKRIADAQRKRWAAQKAKSK